MGPVLTVQNLAKCYFVQATGKSKSAYGYRTLREDVMEWLSAPFGWLTGEAAPEEIEFWALDDVSFQVNKGEVVGIIGHNGAGKSTLLKVLSRITKPTRGEVHLRGRVGSLLEVGTGFHPELTGRENIFLNGAILGMRHHEIQAKFDQIVAFAEIEQFLETPVKRYSSGMYVRLAFAVAAHLEPEILIVDEVLAVGDLSFQRKCMGRMREVGRSGTTILFVSHNMPAVESLCTRAILLDHGKVVMDGAVRELVQEYHRRVLQTHGDAGSTLSDIDSPTRVHKIFRSATLLDDNGEPTNFLPVGGRFHLRVVLDAPIKVESPSVTIGIDDNLGQRLLSLQSPLTNPVLPRLENPGVLDCVVASLPLAPGDYWIKLGFAATPDEIDEIERAMRFTVTEGDLFGSGRGHHRGLCVAPSAWSFQSL
ncbi:MAG: ABC transporter ATP-binding protein [Planctomycetes bacterium]|nr:ABC transporter ATP-binding protein [Planctomycetota bacterium]